MSIANIQSGVEFNFSAWYEFHDQHTVKLAILTHLAVNVCFFNSTKHQFNHMTTFSSLIFITVFVKVDLRFDDLFCWIVSRGRYRVTSFQMLHFLIALMTNSGNKLCAQHSWQVYRIHIRATTIFDSYMYRCVTNMCSQLLLLRQHDVTMFRAYHKVVQLSQN